MSRFRHLKNVFSQYGTKENFYIIRKSKGDVRVIEAKKNKNLNTRYELKNRNGADTTDEFWAMVKEYANNNPYMTPEEVDLLVLSEYQKLYRGFRDADDITNIQCMLRHLKNLIKEFEGIVQFENIIRQKVVSKCWKQEKLSVAEEKLSILLGNLSDVILDYVKGPIEAEDEENSDIWKENKKLEKEIVIYMSALPEKINIHCLGIDKFYYHRIIPFYRKLYDTAKEALNQNNEILLEFP